MIVKKLDNNVDNFSLFRWIGTVLEGIELIAMKEPVFAIDYSSHEANSHNWIILRRDNVMIVLHCKVQIIFSRHNLLSLITWDHTNADFNIIEEKNSRVFQIVVKID